MMTIQSEYWWYFCLFLTNLPLYAIIFKLILQQTEIQYESNLLQRFFNKFFRKLPEKALKSALRSCQDDIESNSSGSDGDAVIICDICGEEAMRKKKSE